MNVANVSNYVRSGDFSMTKKEFRKYPVAYTLSAIIFGVIPGSMMGGWWLLFGFAMLAVAIACSVIIYKVSSYVIITLERYILLNAVIGLGFVAEFSIIELMCFTLLKGLHPAMFLILLPQIVIPLSIGIYTHKKLMKEKEYEIKRLGVGPVAGIGFGTGIFGVSLSRRLLKDVDQGTALVIGITCFAILNAFFSITLLYFQKLHYVRKYNIDFDAELRVESNSNSTVRYSPINREMDAIPFVDVHRTHNVHDFFNNVYTIYNGGRCAKCFFDEYAAVENYKAVAFHYVDGEKYKGIKNYQTLFVLDVYYKKETFFEVSDRILTEHLGQDAKSYFATFDETLDVQFNGCTIKKNKFPYIENNATVLFDPRYHTIRYVFYVHNTGGVEDAKFAIKQTLRIYENAHRNDWIFDYSDLVDSNSSAE